MTRWYEEKRREPYYRQAKREGYRARSAYKLKQINDRFRLIQRGNAVVDLGCSPGGWTQVLVELVGPSGLVVAVDVAATAPVEGATVLQGDLTEAATQQQVRAALGRTGRAADVVVSDMSPNLTGNYDRDQAESVWLAGHALSFARQVLQLGGHLLVKVFEGQDFEAFLADLRAEFKEVRRFHPPASRKRSSEIYVAALGWRGAPPATTP